jgi:hypothetical protein
VNVATWPGASDVDEPEHVPDGPDNDWHVGPDANPPAGGSCVSATDTPVRSTFPVLATANVYVTVSPTADTDAGLADLVIDNAGFCVVATVAVDGGESIGGPDGGEPIAIAESLIDP